MKDLVKGKSYIFKDFDPIMNKDINSVVEVLSVEEQKKNAMATIPGPRKTIVKYRYLSGKYSGRDEVLTMEANAFSARILKEAISTVKPVGFIFGPSGKPELL